MLPEHTVDLGQRAKEALKSDIQFTFDRQACSNHNDHIHDHNTIEPRSIRHIRNSYRIFVP